MSYVWLKQKYEKQISVLSHHNNYVQFLVLLKCLYIIYERGSLMSLLQIPRPWMVTVGRINTVTISNILSVYPMPHVSVTTNINTAKRALFVKKVSFNLNPINSECTSNAICLCDDKHKHSKEGTICEESKL